MLQSLLVVAVLLAPQVEPGAAGSWSVDGVEIIYPDCPPRDTEACRPLATLQRILGPDAIDCGYRYTPLQGERTDEDRKAELASWECVNRTLEDCTPFFFIDQFSGTESAPSHALLFDSAGHLKVLTHDATPSGGVCPADRTEITTCDPVQDGPRMEARLFGLCQPGKVVKTICRHGTLVSE